MAKSGTIWGSFSGKSTSIARPYIVWEAADPNITNNTTLVTAKLYFVRYDGYRSYDNNGQNFTVTLDGTATTQNQPYDIGPNGASDLIMTVSKTVTHNSDGTKTITISASGNTNNSSLGSVSVSGSVTLDTIPRASSFTAFTLSNTVLNTSTATTINYTLDKKSTSFTDYLTLKYGSKTIASWSTTGEGALTRTLTAAEVNSIIVAMPNSTSGTLTLTNQTKNGSTNVGSTTSINEGISLNAAIKPTATGLTASIYGTGRDKTISKYVQSISKVTASFTGTAGYGATESANTIVVRRQSDDANSQTITGESGTTANAVTLSGVYEIIATSKDSRGRSTTQTITITVEAYTAPKITTFTAKRNATTSTTVDATINVSWSALGTSNPTDVKVVGKNNAGVSTTHYDLIDSTAGAVNTTQSYINQSDASSYTYTITLTDSFGKTASATVSVGTSFIEMTIAKGLGVGIGKVHENGALDVKGNTHVDGTVYATSLRSTGGRSYINGGIEIKEADPDDEAMYINWDATNRFFMAPKVNGVFNWGDEFWYEYGNNEWGCDTNFFIGGSRLYFTANRAAGANIEVSSTSGQIYVHYDASNYYRVQSNQQTMVFGSVAWEFTPGTINQTSGNAVFRSATGYCVVKSDGASQDIYLQANSEVRCVAPGTTATYKPCLASAFTVNSKREVKTNIEASKDGALEKVLATKVYDYHLEDELAEFMVESVDEENPAVGKRVKTNSKDPLNVKKRKGLILDEVPEELISGKDNDGIDLYAMNSLLWQAVQELSGQVDHLNVKLKNR